MQQFVQRHRWSVLAAGALIQICTGVPAAWGVFQQGVQDAYEYSQADTALLCGACACFMVNPAEAPQQDAKTKHFKNYSPRQMLRTRQYWLLTAVVALATPSVLLFSPVGVQLGQERGLPQELALLSVLIGSVLSAAGRLGMPWLSDKIGRRYTDVILLAGLAAFSVAFIFAQSGWFIAVYCLLTFCYSGQAAVLPATCTDLYGPRHTGINYGLLALGMSAGSVAFGVLARCLNDLWPRHLIAIAAPLLGVVLLIFIKPTQTKRL